MSVSNDLTLENYRALFDATNLDIILRTVSMAVAVTLACAVIAFPIAYYMTRYGSPAEKGFFYIAVMLPMWASYIVKTYAWTVILSQEGILYWFFNHLGLTARCNRYCNCLLLAAIHLATSNLGRFMVFTYIWLPFMILPIQAALERVPTNLLQASAIWAQNPRKLFVRYCFHWFFQVSLQVQFSPFHSHLAITLFRNSSAPAACTLARWYIPCKALSAICRWRRRLPWCQLC